MDEKTMAHLCGLGLLDCTREELSALTRDMEGILAFMERVRYLPAETREPEDGLPLSALREDLTRPSLKREDVLSSAPETQDGAFTVPKTV